MGAFLHLTLTLFLSALSLATSLNITAVLTTAECNTFSSLISESGVIKSYLTVQKGPGLTIFAPSDDAFKKQKTPDLHNLTSAELVSLLQYHALATYTSSKTIKNITKDPIGTLATNPTGKYDLKIKVDANGTVIVETGVDSGKIMRTAIDESPVTVFVVDRVLLPKEIFANSTYMPPVPAPSPDTSESGVSPPPPEKSGVENVGGIGVLRAVLTVAAAVTVTVFLS